MRLAEQKPAPEGPERQPAVAAAGDLECWFAAAWPPTEAGRFPFARAAKDLEVAESTVRRWAAGRAEPPPDALRKVACRALLRGKGLYRWPGPDAATLERDRDAYTYALGAAGLVDNEPLGVWEEMGWGTPHFLQVLWWPAATVVTLHVTKVAAANQMILPGVCGAEGKQTSLIPGANGRAELVHAYRYPGRHQAVAIMHRWLNHHSSARCVAPPGMVGQAHTHALRPERIVARRLPNDKTRKASKYESRWEYRIDRVAVGGKSTKAVELVYTQGDEAAEPVSGRLDEHGRVAARLVAQAASGGYRRVAAPLAPQSPGRTARRKAKPTVVQVTVSPKKRAKQPKKEQR